MIGLNARGLNHENYGILVKTMEEGLASSGGSLIKNSFPREQHKNFVYLQQSRKIPIFSCFPFSIA